MTTDLARIGPPVATPVQVHEALARHEQSFTRDQVDLLKRTICAGSTDDELALFIKVAERTGLDPFARQIHAVKRWDTDKGCHVMSIQVGIDGFRLIAERTTRYAGRIGPYWCGEDGEWLMDDKGRPKPWLHAGSPSAAMVGVRHKDYTEPLYAIATWRSYVQTKKGGAVTHMWATKGDIMLGKCAEALALRGAFPAELSGLYTADEMGQAGSAATPEPEPEPVELADDWDRQSLANLVEALDEDHRAVFAQRWMDLNLPPAKHPDFNKAHVAQAMKMLGDIEIEAAATYDRRRKHVNAKMGEVGVKGDDDRHQLVSTATDGRTESTKRLSQADVDAVIAFCAEMAADDGTSVAS